MRRTRWAILSGCVTAAVVALPAAAGARTKTVYAGPPPSASKLAGKVLGKGAKSFSNTYNPDINDFFLHRVTINQGDTVKFVIDGFHTVDLPGPSRHDLPPIVPGPTVTGVNDAAGLPFWFNGHVPSLGFNPGLVSPSGASSYNGSARIDSGLPLGPPKPLKVSFTKAGTYKFFCDVHPGMVGYVVVRAKGKSVPSATQDVASLTKQFTTDVRSAKKLAKTKVGADRVYLGLSNSHGVELYNMFPSTLTVPAGTVVRFLMSRSSREVHTASFGPKGYLTGLANSLNSPSPSQQVWYPSDPVQPIPLSPISHGNGYVSTGFMDQEKATPLPSSSRIRFTTPGTYHFICLIHPFMRGTVVVK